MSGEQVAVEPATQELPIGGFDGLHHLWCYKCHPDWAAHPLGVGVGNPFVAWCGVKAVILARWLSDETPPGVCPKCADPETCCPNCGAR